MGHYETVYVGEAAGAGVWWIWSSGQMVVEGRANIGMYSSALEL